MKFEDFFAPVITSFVTVALLVFVYGVPQQGASDTEIATSVSKSVLEFQEKDKAKRLVDLKARVAEFRKKKEDTEKKLKESLSKMTPEKREKALSKLSPSQRSLFMKEGK